MKVVIVLGCNIILDPKTKKYIPDIVLKTRLDRVLCIWNELVDTETIIIVSGGKTRGRIISESNVMSTYLVRNGISKNRIFEENSSVNTIENCVYSFILLEKIIKSRVSVSAVFDHNIYCNYYGVDSCEVRELSPPTEIMLVTSEFHMTRSLKIFNFFIPSIEITPVESTTPKYYKDLGEVNEAKIPIDNMLNSYINRVM